MPIRAMYRGAVEAANYTNWILLPTRADPVSIDREDRRINVGKYQPGQLVISDKEIEQIERECKPSTTPDEPPGRPGRGPNAADNADRETLDGHHGVLPRRGGAGAALGPDGVLHRPAAHRRELPAATWHATTGSRTTRRCWSSYSAAPTATPASATWRATSCAPSSSTRRQRPRHAEQVHQLPRHRRIHIKKVWIRRARSTESRSCGSGRGALQELRPNPHAGQDGQHSETHQGEMTGLWRCSTTHLSGVLNQVKGQMARTLPTVGTVGVPMFRMALLVAMLAFCSPGWAKLACPEMLPELPDELISDVARENRGGPGCLNTELASISGALRVRHR